MKVTKELLKRYGLGLCSEEEKKTIEEWIDTLDDPSMRLSTNIRPTVNKERLWNKIARQRPEVKERMSSAKVRNIILFQNALRYAAAACFVIAVFFVGRLSVTTTYAKPNISRPGSGHLYIYGMNGASTHLPGEVFSVGFEGTIKLYNASANPKIIKIGDREFGLLGFQTYYVSGTQVEPEVQQIKGPQDPVVYSNASGDYSIHRLR